MTLPLRDYQQECLESVISEMKAGVNRQLISLPTGSGKTIIMAAIAKLLNKKTLVIAHREELIQQAYDKFKLFWPDVDIGICMAEKNEIEQQVVIASIQSCSRPKRLARLKELGFDLVLIDEAHHSASDSYQTVVKELGFSADSNKLLIGVSATIKRADNLELGDTFDKVIFGRSIGTMIKAGYLAPVIGRRILTNFSLKGVSVLNGDFAISDLAEAVNTVERNQFISSKFVEYAKDRKAIAFCCDVQHCKDLADAFSARGIASSAVWGEMDTLERKSTLEAFKNNQIQILTSCGILTEGYDEPSVNSIVMARPTRSTALYIQCVGRGLRLWPGKQNCLVLDFTDTSHNLDGIMSLSKTIPEAFEMKEGEQREREEVDRSSKIEVLEDVDREFDILGSARFIWVGVDNEWSLLDDEKNEIVMSPSDGGYVAMLYQANGSCRQIVKASLPLEYCSGVCEDFARRHLKIAFADMSKPWMHGNNQPTKSQREFLEKKGAYRPGMSKAEASIEIRKIVASKNKQRRTLANEPITNKQKYLLINRGIDPSGMSKLDAIIAISKMKQNQQIKYG
jgi:ATP-dependent helicase IRC3